MSQEVKQFHLLEKYKREAKEKSEIHRRLFEKFKVKHMFYGFIPLSLPIIIGALTQLIEDETLSLRISTIGYAVITLSIAIDKFLKLDSKMTKHDFSSYLYENLYDYIEFKKNTKINDINNLLTFCMAELKNLDLFSPDTAPSCCSDMIFNKKTEPEEIV